MRSKKKWWWLAGFITIAGGLLLFYVLIDEPSYQGRKVGDWVSELNSTDSATRDAAEQAVAEIGPAAVPFLKRSVAKTALTETTKIQEFVTAASRYLPKEMGRSMRRKWGAPGGYMAGSGAVRALAELREDATEAVPELLVALDDSDPNVRSQAACALAQITPQDTQVMQRVINKVAKDAEPWVFANFSNYAREIAKSNPEAEGLLLEAIKQCNQDSTRLGFLMALGEMEKPKATTIVFLGGVFNGTNELQRLGAAVALSRWQPIKSEVITVLANGLSSADLSAKMATAKRLMELRVVSPAVEAGMANLFSQNSALIFQPSSPFWLQAYALNYFHLTGNKTNSLPPYLSGNLKPRIRFDDLQISLTLFADFIQVHPKDRQEVKTVVGYLASPAEGVRIAAVGAYRRFCEDDLALSRAPLVALLSAVKGTERYKAAEAIAKLDPENAKLHEVFKKWLVEGGYTSKLETVKVIQTRREFVERYRTELQALTKEKGERLRRAAEKALASVKK